MVTSRSSRDGLSKRRPLPSSWRRPPVVGLGGVRFQHADATAYHRWAWRDVVRAPSATTASTWWPGTANRLVGVLPLVEFGSPLFGTFAVSLPFVNYGGVVADDEPAAARAGAHAAVRWRVRAAGARRAPASGTTVSGMAGQAPQGRDVAAACRTAPTRCGRPSIARCATRSARPRRAAARLRTDTRHCSPTSTACSPTTCATWARRCTARHFFARGLASLPR